jgi:hypothetical protein
MPTIITRMTTTVGTNKHLDLHLSNLPVGPVEIIIVSKEPPTARPAIAELLPKHRLGNILSPLRREDIYTDAR